MRRTRHDRRAAGKRFNNIDGARIALDGVRFRFPRIAGQVNVRPRSVPRPHFDHL
jgi:hypothetical protein